MLILCLQLLMLGDRAGCQEEDASRRSFHLTRARRAEVEPQTADLTNAGAVWRDAPVVIDRHFISSRKPDDLPDFCRAILGWFKNPS